MQSVQNQLTANRDEAAFGLTTFYVSETQRLQADDAYDMPKCRLGCRGLDGDVIPAPAQLAKKLPAGITPPAVHRHRDLRREAAGFVFQRTRWLAPEKPELPQDRCSKITAVRYQKHTRSRP